MRNNKFKTKEEYLQYRKDWKAEYKQLSQIIKDKKWLRNRSNYAWSKAWVECNGKCGFPFESWNARLDYAINVILKNDVYYQEIFNKYKDDRKGMDQYKMEACIMLSELADAKIEAQRQYLAGRSFKNI